MTTIDLLPHEIAALTGLQAVWRPVEPQPEGDLIGPLESQPGVWFDSHHIISGWTCPYGQPGDELICRWKTTRRVVSVPLGGPDDVSEVRHTYRYHITSVAVRRVAEMTVQEAQDWGCEWVHEPNVDASPVFVAREIWHANWPAAEWAWVIGLEGER